MAAASRWALLKASQRGEHSETTTTSNWKNSSLVPQSYGQLSLIPSKDVQTKSEATPALGLPLTGTFLIALGRGLGW